MEIIGRWPLREGWDITTQYTARMPKPPPTFELFLYFLPPSPPSWIFLPVPSPWRGIYPLPGILQCGISTQYSEDLVSLYPCLISISLSLSLFLCLSLSPSLSLSLSSLFLHPSSYLLSIYASFIIYLSIII